MKKNIILSMAGALAAGLLIASCSAKPESVTAVVAGPDGQPAAVVVKYAKAVSAESVTADAFQIEGQEIENVFVTDKDITAVPEKPECKGEKPECDSTKHECDSTKACPEAKPECDGPKSVDGQFVVIVLKKACPEKPACDKAKAECDSTKAACPEVKPECDKAKAECPEAKAECEKAQCDSTKAECDKAKAECDKVQKPACPEIAVPKINVKQVKEIKAADGSAMKAWSKAFPATKAVPCFGPKGPKHHHGEACPEAKAECDKAKAECDGQHKDCPKAEEAK